MRFIRQFVWPTEDLLYPLNAKPFIELNLKVDFNFTFKKKKEVSKDKKKKKDDKDREKEEEIDGTESPIYFEPTQEQVIKAIV